MDICRMAPGRHLAAHTAARTGGRGAAKACVSPRGAGAAMTHILVTGAAGFIGSHLCEALLEQGHVVRGLDAFTTFYDPQRKRGNLEQALAHPSFTLVTGDLLLAPLDEALDGVEWVAHLAGEPGVSTSWGPSFAATSTATSSPQRLLEAAVENGVQRLVYASSSSVYGGRRMPCGPGRATPLQPVWS